jgi:hypothetical protein
VAKGLPRVPWTAPRQGSGAAAAQTHRVEVRNASNGHKFTVQWIGRMGSVWPAPGAGTHR